MKDLSGAKRKPYSQKGRGGTKRARAVKYAGGFCRILNTTQNAPSLWTERRGERNFKRSELARGRATLSAWLPTRSEAQAERRLGAKPKK